MKLFIVQNARSGHLDRDESRQTIADVLASAGRPHEFLAVEDPRRCPEIAQEAVRRAKAEGGAVVVAGGDGTINTVVQQVLGSGCPLGVIPLGTFNLFARTHGVPLDTAEAAQALVDAEPRQVQVGRLNDRVFIVNASLGLYPKLLEDREYYKRQLGRNRLVALWSAVLTVLREHRQISVDIEHDGEPMRLRTPTLFVGNNPLQLEQIGIAEASAVRNGRLAGIAARPVGTWALLGLMMRGALGRLGDSDNVLSFAFRRMTVRPARAYGPQRFEVAIDGEVTRMPAPLVFEVAQQPLTLLAPPATASSEGRQHDPIPVHTPEPMAAAAAAISKFLGFGDGRFSNG